MYQPAAAVRTERGRTKVSRGHAARDNHPNPPALANVQFREALFRGIDRRQMVDEFMHGRSEIAEAWMTVHDEPYWSAVLPKVPRYPYDTAKATQMIEALGYSKRGDGFFYDATGRKLEVELRTTGDNPIAGQLVFPVADYWNRVPLRLPTVSAPDSIGMGT